MKNQGMLVHSTKMIQVLEQALLGLQHAEML